LFGCSGYKVLPAKEKKSRFYSFVSGHIGFILLF
jgi:hypothetical protein